MSGAALRSPMSWEAQMCAQVVIQYLEDLFTASPRETFNRADVLVVLNNVRNDQDFFDADAVADADQLREIGRVG